MKVPLEGLEEICDPGNGKVGVEFNVGIRTGVELESGRKLVVVEGDSEEGCRWIESFRVSETRTSLTARGKHYLLSIPEDVEINNATNIVPSIDKVDVRGEGGFIVAPGSIHVSGHVYRWRNNNPILSMPEDLLKYIVERQESTEKVSSSIVRKHLSGDRSSQTINIGTRHDVLLRIAASLRSRGHDEEYIHSTVDTINETSCEKPLPKAEIAGIVDYACEIEPKRSPISEEVQSLLNELKRAYEGFLFKRPFTISDKAILLALIDQGMILGPEINGGIKITISRRVLAEKSNLSRETVDNRIKVLKKFGFVSVGKDSTNPKDSGYITLQFIVIDQESGEILLDISEEGLLTNLGQDKDNGYVDNTNQSGLGLEMLTSSPSELVKELRNGPGRTGKGAGNIMDSIEEIIVGFERMVSPREIAIATNHDPKNRSHRSSVSRYLRKLRERGLVAKDEETGMYYRPERSRGLLEEDLKEAGEVRDRQGQKHLNERIMNGYRLALKKAAREGRNLDEVPVPDGIEKSRGARILEREKEKQVHHDYNQHLSEEKIEAYLGGELEYQDLNEMEKNEAGFREISALSAGHRAHDYRGKK